MGIYSAMAPRTSSKSTIQNALPPSDLSVAELEGGRFRQPCERMIRRRGARAPRQVASQPVTLAADQVEIHMEPRN